MAKDQSAVIVQISQVELWFIRSMGAVILAVLGWVGIQFHDAIIQIAEIRRELEVVKPSDVLKAVHDLERSSVTIHDIQRIVSEEAPAVKLQHDKRMSNIESTLQVLGEGISDRWRRADMRAWVQLFQAKNRDLSIPDVP